MANVVHLGVKDEKIAILAIARRHHGGFGACLRLPVSLSLPTGGVFVVGDDAQGAFGQPGQLADTGGAQRLIFRRSTMPPKVRKPTTARTTKGQQLCANRQIFSWMREFLLRMRRADAAWPSNKLNKKFQQYTPMPDGP